MSEDDPVARYKGLLKLVNDGAQRMAELERRRARELADELVDAKRAMADTTEDEKKVNEEIKEWWRQVSGKLVELKWINAGPAPKPDEQADPKQLDDYLDRVEPATKKLFAALRKASWRSGS